MTNLIGNAVNVAEPFKLQSHLKNVQAVEKFVILKMSPVIPLNVVDQAILTLNFDSPLVVKLA